MTEESAADRQAAMQAREQEKKQADSATAVSPDTQFSDPGEIVDDQPQEDLSSRGQSTVFDDPAKPRASSNVDHGPSGAEQPRPAGLADVDRNPDQAGDLPSVDSGTDSGPDFGADSGADEHDQDADPPTPTGEELPTVTSGGNAAGEASYGEEQDAAPSQPPYEQK